MMVVPAWHWMWSMKSSAIFPIRFAEAPSYGTPISAFAPESTAAKAYAALAKEILAQDGIIIPVIEE